MNFLTFLIIFFALSCSSVKQAHDPIADYKKTAQTIVAQTRRGADSHLIAKMGKLLIEKARPILQRVRKNNPACQKVLNIVLEKSLEMTRLDLESIERDYHHGAALPESQEECYEAKELVVHPATVVILATQKYDLSGRKQIIDEIEEVLAHIDMLL